MFPSVYFYDSHQGKCRVQEMWYALRIAKKKKIKRNHAQSDSGSS